MQSTATTMNNELPHRSHRITRLVIHRRRHVSRRHEEIIQNMTAGAVPVRDMGRVGKELGKLETVLEKHEAMLAKALEIRDLEEVGIGSDAPRWQEMNSARQSRRGTHTNKSDGCS